MFRVHLLSIVKKSKNFSARTFDIELTVCVNEFPVSLIDLKQNFCIVYCNFTGHVSRRLVVDKTEKKMQTMERTE